jgi:hypothetical protein
LGIRSSPRFSLCTSRPDRSCWEPPRALGFSSDPSDPPSINGAVPFRIRFLPPPSIYLPSVMMMMTTRPSSFSGFLALPLLLLAVAAALLPQPAQADLLTLLVNATNAPAGALGKAQADAHVFLQKFVSLEGSSYRAVAPGQEVDSVGSTSTTTGTTAVDNNNDAVRRLLRGGGRLQGPEVEEEVVGGGHRPDQGRHPKLGFDLPEPVLEFGQLHVPAAGVRVLRPVRPAPAARGREGGGRGGGHRRPR